MERYAYSVIKVSAHLAEVACGSSDAFSGTVHQARWLRWRLTQWERLPHTRYSVAVREMAQAALQAYETAKLEVPCG